jgi:hypothetical protein
MNVTFDVCPVTLYVPLYPEGVIPVRVIVAAVGVTAFAAVKVTLCTLLDQDAAVTVIAEPPYEPAPPDTHAPGFVVCAIVTVKVCPFMPYVPLYPAGLIPARVKIAVGVREAVPTKSIVTLPDAQLALVIATGVPSNV